MKYNLTKKISYSIIILVLLVGLTLTTFFGMNGKGYGSAKDINLGLDLAGGVSITYEIQEDNPTSQDIEDTIYKLEKRIEGRSTESQVYKEGDKRITVEIPGVTDANEILTELGTPGSLEFLDYTGYTAWSQGQDYTPLLTGSDVKAAQAYSDTSSNESTPYGVSLTFTDEGSDKFADATSKNIGSRIYIIYDGAVVSYPTVNTAITGGSASITGMETYEAADNLATYIRIGSIPLTLKEASSNIVGAQLGQDAIHSSLIAAGIGFMLLCIFMIAIYRVPGVVATLSLIIYTTLVLFLVSVYDLTLTLPGIAGIILGIGMAVDANVIIYARIREEIGTGSTVRSAIKAGFSKAFSAIFDGNITTLIAAFVLMWLGTGSVKGFAYTLALGIVISMFTALVFSRLVINALYAVGVRDEKFYGKTEEKKVINFVGKRRLCFTLSIILILAGPATMLIHKATGGKALNYSLEFSGGTSTNVTFNEDMDIKTIDSEVTPVVEEVTGDKNVQPTKVVGTNQVIIKTRSLNLDEREALNKALVDKFGVDESLIQAESISSTVSNEMRRDAVVAVFVATIFMLLYIWFRFKDIRFAGSAVLALLHDVLVVLTFYAISRISVGNTFIACMLTIVGYSINATIVIFDRIRENLHGSKRVDELEEVVNKSITQTLTRSIYTSLTTFIMVAVLYIMGVSSIREFAAPLMVGIICGAYSSVCITGALWLVMKKKIGGGQAQTVKATAGAAPVKQSVSSAKAPSAPAANGQTQPKKKNRKRVQERLAAQEAAKNAENGSSEEDR